MAIVKLQQLAIARSGDKGNISNIGIMARSSDIYEYLCKKLTADVVKSYFKEITFGNVIRYDLPNLNAFNFILEDALGGGGTETLLTDAQGKVYGAGLLHLEMDIPDKLFESITMTK
ncbi:MULTISPECIES: hypothetical protein [unclassified Microbulbifer]|uniref:AtuA-like ferredoxin-fold domain-containing protein n=1 Tax=Microbulbifer spongiae TaxID=2944933 RepID=A0ABY9E9L4_9GAMM|nr:MULTISPECIES: hypothetical protein [unclassified Microbulbifer]MDP5209281.1 hypothetical protein [Microbulbifer sp. 2205BS26-8]WKD49046.1 hypothetical protein M8T91_14245 [Microbulbifer sp. MI-G]